MNRVARLLLLGPLGFLVAALGSSAAPVPTHLMPEWVPYHPTRVGDTWTLALEDSDATRTYTVTAVEGKARAKVVTVGRVTEDGKVVPREKLLVSEAGILRTELWGEPLRAPLCMLGLPHRPGEKWDVFLGRGRDVGWGGTAVAREVEEVEVPAGKFRAIAVHATWAFNGDLEQHETLWWAPEVGAVMVREPERNGPRIWVMKSFTRGSR